MATLLLTMLILSIILLAGIAFYSQRKNPSDCKSCEYCLNQQSEVERPVL